MGIGQDTAGYGGISSTSHPLATAAGIGALLRGGNAVDAAIASGFALSVVEPSMSGIGGQGNCIVFMREDERPTAVDFYAVAPSGAREDMYRWVPGPTQGEYRFHTRGDENTTGPRAVAVPGNVAGWLYCHRRWGALPLQQVIAPAVEYAQNGFPLTPRVAGHLDEAAGRLQTCPESRRIWFRADGSPLSAGDRVRLPQLARTLQLIGREGEDAFYRGETPDRMIDDLAGRGGLLAREDLSSYPADNLRAVEPESVKLGDLEVFATPTSSSVVFLMILKIFEGFGVSPTRLMDARDLHLLIESMKLAFADRRVFSGDPAFVNVPVRGLLSEGYLAQRRSFISPDCARCPEPGDPWPWDPNGPGDSKRSPREAGGEDPEVGTTHHSHVDRWGNMVAMTQSLGDAFGSAVMAPGLGFFWNNAMKLFDPRPGRANSIEPGKRPSTAPCPVLVTRGGLPFMALGSPSGTRIINSVVQVLVRVLGGLTLQEAVLLPRVHWSGAELEIEGTMTAEALGELRNLGHDPSVFEGYSPWFGAVQAVSYDASSGLCRGAADPRRQGAVAAATLLDEKWAQASDW